MWHGQFIKDQAASLPLFPDGGPASGSVYLSLFDCEGNALSANWTQKTVIAQDDFSEELTADAAAGTKNLVMDDTSDLRQDWRGWLVNDYGQGEEVIVDGVKGTSVRLANALTYTQDVSGTPKPTLVRHLYKATIPANVLDTEQRGAYAFWEWQDADGNWKYKRVEFDVVRTPWYVPVTMADVRRVYPDVLNHASTTWKPLLEGAKEVVRLGIEAVLVKGDLVARPAMFVRLCCIKLAITWLLQKGTLNQDELDLVREWRREFKETLALTTSAELEYRTRTDFIAV